MVRRAYVPDRGDLIWLTFSPQAGREQAGRRPALVLSPRLYNERSGLVVVCPITSRAKGYPFEVPLPEGTAIAGVVLVDQIRSVDWQSRRAHLAAQAPAGVLDEAAAKLRVLLVV